MGNCSTLTNIFLKFKQKVQNRMFLKELKRLNLYVTPPTMCNLPTELSGYEKVYTSYRGIKSKGLDWGSKQEHSENNTL